MQLLGGLLCCPIFACCCQRKLLLVYHCSERMVESAALEVSVGVLGVWLGSPVVQIQLMIHIKF